MTNSFLSRVLLLSSLTSLPFLAGCTSDDPPAIDPGCTAGQTCSNAGSSGAAGTGASAGTAGSGAAGNAGQSGTSGTAGSAAQAGHGGTSGTSGTSGHGGDGGTGGMAGDGGTGGEGGVAATGGTAGTGGTGGSAGESGSAGTAGAATGGTAGMAGSAGTAPACTSNADCLGSLAPLCVVATCSSGACDMAFQPAGTVLPDSTTGDCKHPACDGAGVIVNAPNDSDAPVQVAGDCQILSCSATGEVVSAADDSDIPADTDECNLDVCTGGVPSNPPAPAGTACGMMGVCNGADTCGVCTPDATRCSATGTSQVCSSEGQWMDSTQCGTLGCDTDDNGNLSCVVPKQVTVGADFSCALLSNGKVRCWGAGAEGELGAGLNVTASAKPVEVKGLTGVTKLSSGLKHSCALTTAGQVLCWGSNDVGQLGAGLDLTQKAFVPVAVTPNNTTAHFDKLYNGWNDTCSHDMGTTVKCWGKNAGNLTGTTQPSGQIPATVNAPTDIKIIDGFTSVPFSIGAYTGCSINSTGFSCWGTNSTYEIDANALRTATFPNGHAKTDVINATAVSVGEDRACIIGTPKTMVSCWGSAPGATQSAPPTVYSLHSYTLPWPVAEIQAGVNNQCALTIAETLYCWGDNPNGQLGTPGSGFFPTSPTAPTQVAGVSLVTSFALAKKNHSCLVSGGKAYCMGAGVNDVLGSPGGVAVVPREVVW